MVNDRTLSIAAMHGVAHAAIRICGTSRCDYTFHGRIAGRVVYDPNLLSTRPMPYIIRLVGRRTGS